MVVFIGTRRIFILICGGFLQLKFLRFFYRFLILPFRIIFCRADIDWTLIRKYFDTSSEINVLVINSITWFLILSGHVMCTSLLKATYLLTYLTMYVVLNIIFCCNHQFDRTMVRNFKTDYLNDVVIFLQFFGSGKINDFKILDFLEKLN